MPNKVSISVIVPVYKVEPYIRRCVNSILNQTFTDFELILVDDGSPDNCGKICDEYAEKDHRVHVIHKQNSGVSDARNQGIDWALDNNNSEWITFIDSDDWIHNQFLEILYNTALKNNVKISCCGYISADDCFIGQDKINHFNVVVDHAQDLVCNMGHDEFNLGVPWGRLYKKELFISLRFPPNRYYEDGFIIYKALFAVSSIAVVDCKFYYFYSNPNSTTRSKATNKKTSDFIDAMVQQINFFEKGGYWKSYEHEVGLFLYRCGVHLALYKNDPELKEANKKFILTARKIIRHDRKRFTFGKCSDSYKLVFNPFQYFLYKINNKLLSLLTK